MNSNIKHWNDIYWVTFFARIEGGNVLIWEKGNFVRRL